MKKGTIISKDLFYDVQNIHTEVKRLNKKIKSLYEGKTIVIPGGRYKDRWGKVENIHYDPNTFISGTCIIAMVRPYRLDRKRGTLLDDIDARSYWAIDKGTVFYETLEEAKAQNKRKKEL